MSLHIPHLGYKYCAPHFVELDILGDNDESREVIDPKYAEYRTSRVRVLRIIDDKRRTLDVDECVSSYYGKKKRVYRVGEIVSSVGFFNEPADWRFRGGIYYFKTFEGIFAFYMYYCAHLPNEVNNYACLYTIVLSDRDSRGKITGNTTYTRGKYHKKIFDSSGCRIE
jgi:hypothetical protein